MLQADEENLEGFWGYITCRSGHGAATSKCITTGLLPATCFICMETLYMVVM